MKITNHMLEYLQWIKDQTIGKKEKPEFFIKVDKILFSELVFKNFILVKNLGGFKYLQITSEGIRFLNFADSILKRKNI